MTENGFWEYGNLWRNGGDRYFVRYATTEPSPANTECDLCGDNSNNNSSTMADEKKKKPPEDAPEIKMVESNPGQLHSIQFQILITAKQLSLKEYPTAKPNTSNEKAPTNDLNKSSMFANNLFDTKQNQNHRKKEACNGNCVQNDDNASKGRDGIAQFTFRESALNMESIIFH